MQEPSQRTTLLRLSRWVSTPVGLATLFALGLLIRLLIAPHVGFYGDLRLFGRWSARLANVGTGHFYAPGYFADYPPGYLYVLLIVGKISRAVGSEMPGYVALKLPAILADLGVAWVAGELAVRLKSEAMPDPVPVRAIGASAILFNPASIALGAVWGQVDSVPVFLVVASLLLLLTGQHRFRRDVAGIVVLALGVSMKPQAGFVLPVVALALALRYFAEAPSNRARLRGLLKTGVLALVGYATWAVTGLPFGLQPRGLYDFYKQSAAVYPYTSAWAFNLWGWIGGFWRFDSAAKPNWIPARVLHIQALHFGFLLFAIGTALILRRAYLALDKPADRARVFFFSAAATSLLGYAVLTRMHERYLFIGLACLAPLAFIRPMRRGLGVLSALFVLNLYLPYVIFNQQWNNRGHLIGVRTLQIQPVFSWIYGDLLDGGAFQKKLLSFLVLVSCLSVAAFGWRWLGLEKRGVMLPVRDVTERIAKLRQRVVVFVERLTRRSGRTATVESTNAPEIVDVVATESRATRRWPVVAVGVAVLFNLILIRHQTVAADNLNDSSFHMQMVRWAVYQIRHGHIPLDGWYPLLTMGSAHFHHYQSLAHVITAFFGLAFGADRTFLWSLYVLLATWPIAVYWAGRLFGWDRWTAAAAAVLSSFVTNYAGLGLEHSSYVWSGWGVWSQLWAAWLLPISWATSWRAVARKGPIWVAAIVLTFTMALHFIVGYLAVLPLAVWVLIGQRDRIRRAGRALLVGGGAALGGAWFLVPLTADRKWATRSIYYVKTDLQDSYGARRILGWLFTGRIFDSGRFPILTLFAAAGVVVCIREWKRNEGARAVLGVTVFCLVLYFGRPTLGPLLRLIPGNDDIQMHRFVIGVHMGGILLAGIGAAALGRLVLSALQWFRPHPRFLAQAGVTALALIVVVPLFVWLGRYHVDAAHRIDGQRVADATDGRDATALIAIAKARGGGRIYGGIRSNWGREYRVGAVPMYAVITDHDADGIGFTFRTIASLSNDVEAAFNDTNPANFDLFNVRYLIYQRGRRPSAPARIIASQGRHALWQVHTSGYLDVVDTTAPVYADRTNLATRMNGFLNDRTMGPRLYPTIGFAGRPAASPTWQGGGLPPDRAGKVLNQSDLLMDGIESGEIVAKRPAVVLLKATFDPRWRVFVDGKEQQAQMIAPSYVGVGVSPGTHRVLFIYTRYNHYGILLLFGLLAIGALLFWERRTPPTVR